MGLWSELDDKHKAMLVDYFVEGLTPQDIAAKYGVTVSVLSHVKSSPAGVRFVGSLMTDAQGRLNMKVASLLLDRVDRLGQQLPIEVLIKIYSATARKEAPASFADVLRAEANRLADELRLSEASRAKLLEFASGNAA